MDQNSKKLVRWVTLLNIALAALIVFMIATSCAGLVRNEDRVDYWRAQDRLADVEQQQAALRRQGREEEANQLDWRAEALREEMDRMEVEGTESAVQQIADYTGFGALAAAGLAIWRGYFGRSRATPKIERMEPKIERIEEKVASDQIGLEHVERRIQKIEEFLRPSKDPTTPA